MSFTCIQTEGGLIPADLLEEIAAGETHGQGLADFGLPRGARLTDEIAAVKPVVGDDKGLERGLRKRNRQGREEQLDFFAAAELPDVNGPDFLGELVRVLTGKEID